jgi:hypothetical protein
MHSKLRRRGTHAHSQARQRRVEWARQYRSLSKRVPFPPGPVRNVGEQPTGGVRNHRAAPAATFGPHARQTCSPPRRRSMRPAARACQLLHTCAWAVSVPPAHLSQLELLEKRSGDVGVAVEKPLLALQCECVSSAASTEGPCDLRATTHLQLGQLVDRVRQVLGGVVKAACLSGATAPSAQTDSQSD